MKNSFTMAVSLIFLILSAYLPVNIAHAQDDTSQLIERANQYWQAKVKGDYAVLYDFLSPEEKGSETSQEYATRMKDKGVFQFLSFKIEDAQISSEIGWVRVDYETKPIRYPKLNPSHRNSWTLWKKIDQKWYPMSTGVATTYPTLPPKLRLAEEESALTKRAEAYWTAIQNQDMETVYKYYEPKFKATMSLEEFMKKKQMNLYLSHRIDWAEVSSPNFGVVRVTFSSRPNDQTLAKARPIEKSLLESWVKVDNEWYRSLTKPE